MAEKEITEEPEPVEKKGVKISEKQLKRIIVVVIIIVVVGIILWGMVPEKTYEVSEIADNPAGFDGKEVNVKGQVKGWNSGSNFTLADETNPSKTIQ